MIVFCFTCFRYSAVCWCMHTGAIWVQFFVFCSFTVFLVKLLRCVVHFLTFICLFLIECVLLMFFTMPCLFFCFHSAFTGR
ncbi:putative mucin-associated surface protein (MASP) [Trypanosoma cruzi Dm28c]|uniref:Putative mucin-associated surface protein (MASP) n=1 Tax=Trypanosoma cruzi Dm28c TaxID=1416333 RepID=V5D7K5_TRYCR|nr:putative mucin-associated surface protein (MASP) [Trypanosoma cruzi Dm28c]